MDKIEKFLLRLPDKERTIIIQILTDVKDGNVGKYDIKKLRGHNHIYRIRNKDFRIIFTKNNGTIEIVGLARRNEKTYREFK